ncbi:hypothetical protein AB0E67_34305 [Streptomyces sp. NPDC032161]|uniref:hypothetical protein n=1 Tax=unclassified Streptomyces TaxID=2593676 RepID=UPI0033CCC96C
MKMFVGMGRNFAMAAPDTAYTHEALRRCGLTVQVSTELSRGHLPGTMHAGNVGRATPR